MNRVFVVRGGVKPACSNSFSDFRYLNNILKLKKLFTIHYSQFTKKLFAFTLAETLIVMGVIGIVAALTLPNLNQSTNNKEKVAKLQKIYQNLSDAYGRAVAVYGPSDTWYGTQGNSNSDDIQKNAERIAEFLKASPASLSNVGVDKYLDGSISGSFIGAPGHTVKTADGTLVKIVCDSHPQGFIVDIDGANKGSFTWGKDLFTFLIESGEIYPAGYNHTDQQLKDNCFKKGNFCAGWVIQNGNMDYLKCPSSLSWTNITCK